MRIVKMALLVEVRTLGMTDREAAADIARSIKRDFAGVTAVYPYLHRRALEDALDEPTHTDFPDGEEVPTVDLAALGYAPEDRLVAVCPCCGADAVVGLDRIQAAAQIAHFRYKEGGEVEPTWFGDTKLFWETQDTVPGAEYCCTRCGETFRQPKILPKGSVVEE